MSDTGGSEARELSKLIPIGNIKAYTILFELLSKISVDKGIDPPDTEINKIRRALIRLCRQSWITLEDFTFLRDELYRRMESSPAFLKLAEKISFQKKGAPRNHALDILIYSLIFDLKFYTGKPHYKLVADFLLAKEFISADEESIFGAESLRKRYERLSYKEILLIFSNYLQFYDLLSALSVLIVPHKISDGFLKSLSKPDISP